MIGNVDTIKRVIRDQGLTTFYAHTIDGEKIAYKEGTVAEVVDCVDLWVNSIANGTVFIIECWGPDAKKRPGNPGGKDTEKSARCKWTVQGRNGAPVASVPAYPEPVNGLPHMDAAYVDRLARLEAQLEFEKQQREALEEELSDMEEEEEEADEEEEGEVNGPADPATGILGRMTGEQVVDVVGKILDRFAPVRIPKQTQARGTALVNGPAATPMTGAGPDEEKLLAAWRKMREQQPAVALDLEQQLLSNFGEEAAQPSSDANAQG